MPYNPRISRKPSTCSLPAALLTENRVATPSSSVDGLSPTDSTCSLDKATLIVSQTGGGVADMFYPLNGVESPASYDAAVLKAVTAAQGGSGRDGTLKNSAVSPPLSVTSPSSPLSRSILSPPAISDVDSNVSKSTLTRSSVGVAGGVSKSWADRLDDAGEDEREARTPEWAQMHRDTRSSTPSQRHTPLSKRHSAEPSDGWSHHSDPMTSARGSYHPQVSRVPPAGQTGNWLPRPPGPLLQNSHLPSGRRHRGPPQSVTPLGVNGLVPSLGPPIGVPPVLQRPYLPSPGSGVAYTPVLTNHSRGSHQPPPPVCFNCGKKGHYGASCPADTIHTNNPDSKSTIATHAHQDGMWQG